MMNFLFVDKPPFVLTPAVWTNGRQHTINDNGTEKNVLDCVWIDRTAKESIDQQNEYFVGVQWIRTVSADDGYREKGMISLPMVAYMVNDDTTHKKVLRYFNISVS